MAVINKRLKKYFMNSESFYNEQWKALSSEQHCYVSNMPSIKLNM